MRRPAQIGVVVGALCTASWSLAADSTDARDLEGPWIATDMALFMGVDLPYTPAGQNLMAERIDKVKEGHSMASPHLTCRPTGVQNVMAPKSTILILQSPQTIHVITQEDREVRFVHMNRPHPGRLVPSYSGDSVGRWEGNALVIDTIGYNGKGQLDEVGNPQSERSHVVERWTKSSDGRQLTVEFTFTDAVYYTKPFTRVRHFQSVPGARIADYDCAENPRSDDYDNLTFANDDFKPTCVRPVVNGVAGDKVVCTSQASRR
jgi:hypothetical protein